jgi:heme a synthase
VLGGVTIFAGTVATAAGPHAGGDGGQLIHRLHFRGAETLEWVIHRHATLATTLGLGVILAWFLARRRNENQALIEALTVAGILMAAQGLVGSVQYGLELPADIVWVHVTLATVNWIVLLWCVGAAGRLAPRGTSAPPTEPGEPVAPPLEALARR